MCINIINIVEESYEFKKYRLKHLIVNIYSDIGIRFLKKDFR